ncbi:Uncharacterised protein [Brevibacterium casei]|uniref:Uncharacterized protein n=1 Tax=Brevibacterium casei TaxID=33889 RepID=A0A449CYM0_9MICO|nr:Uncharacterised protein [Brevibacterium casei]
MNCDQHLGFHTRCAQCTADRLEALEWLAGLGEAWTCLTVRRAGYPSLYAAERALNRAGRGDIATQMKRNTHSLERGAHA